MQQQLAHNHATYALYVGAAREAKTLALIERHVSDELYDELYCPRYKKAVRRQGEWKLEDAVLVPGYLFAQTASAQSLRDALQGVPALTKVLSMGEELVPLGEHEVAWLNELTTSDERTVGFSRGLIEGDRAIVTSGPLMGHESQIVKIDRHKRLAWLSFHILGRVKEIQVGLEIVSKVPGKAAKAESR